MTDVKTVTIDRSQGSLDEWYTNFWSCPNPDCDEIHSARHFIYCPSCGAHTEWVGEEPEWWY